MLHQVRGALVSRPCRLTGRSQCRSRFCPVVTCTLVSAAAGSLPAAR